MPSAKSSEENSGIPQDYLAIPILEADAASALRLCVLVRQTPDPAAGHLVLLRDLPDASVYLGCVSDAGLRLREWVELWVQNVDSLEASFPAMRELFSNHALDLRWGQMADGLCAVNSNGFIRTGWETKHPLPVFLDLARREGLHPGDKENRWELCQDDAALAAAGLPAYSTSLVRYLYQRGSKNGPFVVAVAGAPANANTRPIAEAWENSQAQIPLNPQGGLLMAQSLAPIGYEQFVDLLGGQGWKGIEHGKRFLNLGGVYSKLDDWGFMQQSGSHLFLGGQGKAGWLVETFHLKLQLLMDVITAARGFVEKEQLPFLNLSGDSFGVRLPEVGAKLPFLWNSKVSLIKPSQAYPLPVETSDFRYFIRLKAGGTSIYQPEGVNVSQAGACGIRIRKVLPLDQGRTQLEATLVLQETIHASPHDLIWIRLPLPSGRVDLYGHLYKSEGSAQGEARLRTVHQMLPQETVKALRAAEGVSFARSPFEVVPLLSTPYDMYALGVLAVRGLLVNPQTTLAIAVDEIVSLARRVASMDDADKTAIPVRIGAILSQDSKLANALGPHRLLHEPMEPSVAFGLLPAELWYETLAMIMRLFPGVTRESYCKDYGDAPALALDAVFDKPLEDLDKLLLRSRSLIVIDWTANREVHSAIRDVMDRQVGAKE